MCKNLRIFIFYSEGQIVCHRVGSTGGVFTSGAATSEITMSVSHKSKQMSQT